MTFDDYQPVHRVSTDPGPYGDALNHCENYRYYAGGGDRITAVHECSHGIASQIRKGRTNGFYLLENRAIGLDEPDGKKSDCVKFIPADMRYGRFATYVTGQREWEDSPLYLFDEWVAYRNGAACLLYEDGKEGLGTDYLFGPIEFATYGIATAMAHPRADLTEFTKWLLADVLEMYQRGRAKFGWPDAAKCYGQLKTNAAMRSFLGDFRFPDEAEAPVDYVP